MYLADFIIFMVGKGMAGMNYATIVEVVTT